MHATHFHPRHSLMAGLAALLLALLVMAVMATDVGTIDFSLGGGDASQPAAVETAAPRAAEPPAWFGDPMASPLEALRAPVR